jgi:amino acid adenylation domain-containing protein/non-ribosomal peptide synthase protein (TIGR01720 family)
VVGEGEPLSGEALIARADGVAAALLAAGLRRGDVVAITSGRSVEAVIALLGVLLAGGATLLVEPSDPVLALRRAITRAGARFVVGARSVDGLSLPLITPGASAPPGFVRPDVGLDETACLGAAASGYVRLSHRALGARAVWLLGRYGFGPGEVVLWGSPLATTGYVRGVLAPLALGAKVAVPITDDGMDLLACAAHAGVTVADLCPSAVAAWGQTSEALAPSLHTVLAVGEPLPRAVAAAFAARSDALLEVLHVPPGAGVEVLVHVAHADEAQDPLALGRPAALAAYVLDEQLRPLPVGVAGELCVSGDGLALPGPGADAERWVPSPLEEGATLYRTRELVRLGDDGEVSFVGTTNRTVWMSGRRVRCEEVEAALLSHAAIADAAVLAKKAESGARELVAYFVAKEPVPEDELRNHLTRHLPVAFVPHALAQVARIPLTAAGELDEALLGAVPVAIEDVAARWEERVLELQDVLGAAAVTVPVREEPKPLHLLDLVPGYRALTAGKSPHARLESRVIAPDAPRAETSGGPFELPADAPRTLDEALAQAAAAADRKLVFLDGADAAVTLTYAELRESALRILGGLRAKGLVAGERVILQLATNRELVLVYWACILGGIVPVPIGVAPTYREPNATVSKLENAWRLLGGPLVVASDALAPEIRALPEVLGTETFRVESLESLATAPPAVPHLRSPDDVAVLLLTSGSTGLPKGVALRDRNILARTFAMRSFIDLRDGDVTLNWMPLDHVVGLVMYHTRDVILRAHQVHAATSLVLEDPLRWLGWLERYRVTVTWAPNFAFGLVNQHAARIAEGHWDLSSVRIIQNGGEAVVARTARRFLAQLAPHGLASTCMFPGWGMSETSSAVTFNRAFRVDGTSDDDSFVDLGHPIPGFSMRIVDTEDRVLPEGAVGRLQVQGPSVFGGYYEAPELSREVFTTDGWFDTGDLAFLQDGRLTLTGREKDVIIIRGINYASHEIEAIAEEIPGILPSFTAAVAVRRPGSDTDDLALFFVPEHTSEGYPMALAAELREAVGKAMGLYPEYVIPVGKYDVPKTSIGKIQRSQLARAFGQGAFDDVVKALDIAGRTKATLPAWFYEKRFVPRVFRGASFCCGRVLVLAEGELARALAEALRSQGAEVTVAPGDAASAALASAPFDDVLIATAIGPRAEPSSAAELLGAQERVFFPVLDAYQAMARAATRPTRLLVVTSQTFACASGETVAYERGTLPGLLRTIALEAPWLDVRQLDVDDATCAAPAALAHAVALELTAPPGEGEVALRGGARLVARVVPLSMELAKGAPSPIEQGGLYLVAGALGGVGSAIAARLLTHFGVHLLAVGRTPLPPRETWSTLPAGSPVAARVHTLASLEGAGGQVVYEAVDITDGEALERVVAAAEVRFGRPLAGVIHAAGEGDITSHLADADARLAAAETRAGVELYFRTKLAGTFALFSLVRSRPAAAFVAFSSVNGSFGGATFGAYSAASSFLDAFCTAKRWHGHARSMSFGWAMWDGLGMNAAASDAVKEGSKKLGYHLIDADAGYFSFLAGLAHGGRPLLVGLDAAHPEIQRASTTGPLTAEEVRVVYEAAGDLSGALASLAVSDRFGTPTHARFLAVDTLPLTPDGFVDRDAVVAMALSGEGGATRERVLPRTDTERAIAAVWQEILGLTSVSVLDNFFELGGHSLRATQVVARLRDALGVELPLATLFEGPTIAELAAAVDSGRKSHAPVAEIVIPRLPDGGQRARLSPSQERLWFLDQLEKNSAFYNISGAARLIGALDPQALTRALDAVVRRHDVLRTTFVTEGGSPSALVHDEPGAFFVRESWVRMPKESREAALAVEVSAEAQRPFTLDVAPLLRVKLIELGGEPAEHVLIVTMHHIVSDGWSVGVFVREVVTLYEAFVRGAESPLLPLAFQYADYAAYQRSLIEAGAHDAQLAHWKETLRGVTPSLELPTDRPRPAAQTYRGRKHWFALDRGLVGALDRLAQHEDATRFMVLLAAWNVLLARLARQEDVVVGTPIANRQLTRAEELIGFFLNTLPMRVNVTRTSSFRELLARVKAVALSAYANQDVSFERLVNELSLPRDLSRSPLFQVMFVLMNTPLPPLEIGGLSIALLDSDPGTSQLDLLLSIEETDDGALRGYLQYNTDLFDEKTAGRLAERFVALLEGIVVEPSRAVGELPILSRAERQEVLLRWNDTGKAYPTALRLHQLFEAQVQRTPDAVAVVFEDQRLTYAELDQRANQLAHHLRRLGVGPETLVGVCMERSLEMIVALYGTLKAGGAYVPIDPTYPRQRIAFFLEDSATPVLLTQDRLVRELPALSAHRARVLRLDSDWNVVASEPTSAPKVSVGGRDLAYMIYTSGSTGQPKGAMNTHEGIVNRLLWMQEAFALGPNDAVLQKTPFSFDVSVWELFWPLLVGARLVVAKPEGHKDPAYLAATIRAESITTLHFVPSMLRAFLDFDGLGELLRDSTLRRVVASGEALTKDLVERFYALFPDAQLDNLYGPTEAAVDVTWWPCAKDDPRSSVPIGRPIANTQLYVLEPNMAPAPMGALGELHIGGVQLARGYWKRPELTAERFVTNPFAHGGSGVDGRLYKTGDLARWTEGGVLEYAGRLDFQVKLRGFRIELGEIEAALEKLPGVKQAAVLVREDVPGDKRLVGYVAADEPGPTAAELRAYLKADLPEHMIPTVFVLLPSLPLSPSGKVERRGLPAPEVSEEGPLDPAEAPRTPLEEQLAGIFAGVLRRKEVGIHQSFFALGGDSILSIQVVSRAKEHGIELTPRLVFQHQSVAELAAAVGTVSLTVAEQGPVTGEVPLTPVQRWFFESGYDAPQHHNQALLLEVDGRLDLDKLTRAWAALLSHHDALRARFVLENGGARQTFVAPGEAPSVRGVDLRTTPDADLAARIEQEANAAQASLDLENGPLHRVLAFDLGDGRPARLLIVLHHLVTDGVSWRVLVGDLFTAYGALLAGRDPTLPAKTTSYLAWATRLVAEANTPRVLGELSYWLAAQKRGGNAALPRDRQGSTLRGETAIVRVSIGAKTTRELLEEAPSAYGTDVSDLCLAALARAITRWRGDGPVAVDLEGHGREELGGGETLDVTRTVGWFTTVYPVWLDGDLRLEPPSLVKGTKEALRDVPQKGLGYGLLRYLATDPAVGALREGPAPELVWNYLGRLDNALPEDSGLRLAKEPTGRLHAPSQKRRHLLEVNAEVSGGELVVSFVYGSAVHDAATIERLADDFRGELERLVAHCLSPDAGGYTPSDFRRVKLEADVLDSIVARLGKRTPK